MPYQVYQACIQLHYESTTSSPLICMMM